MSGASEMSAAPYNSPPKAGQLASNLHYNSIKLSIIEDILVFYSKPTKSAFSAIKSIVATDR
jgi:hypothetical protein